MPSWTKSNDSANELQRHDTSGPTWRGGQAGQLRLSHCARVLLAQAVEGELAFFALASAGEGELVRRTRLETQSVPCVVPQVQRRITNPNPVLVAEGQAVSQR
jgi:hypothetical protein